MPHIHYWFMETTQKQGGFKSFLGAGSRNEAKIAKNNQKQAYQ